jgi:mannose-1-phosphate guanylyltransferase/mannose-6-phosphate isomerase
MSNRDHPKQFLNLLGNHSLIRETVSRLEALESLADPIIVCNNAHRLLVAQHMRDAGRWPCSVILEPEGRNTAPAIAMAALHAAQTDPDAVLLIMPADHVIADPAEFKRAILDMVQLARDGALITYGIVPSAPETGYGYIRSGAAVAGTRALRIDAFVEKPDAETAQGYLKSGDYFWNSGIFMATAGTVLREMQAHAPDILECCQASFELATRDASYIQLELTRFMSCRSESFDYAVMEKTQSAVIRPVSMGWNDVGSWDSLWQVHDKDESGNAVMGDVTAIESSGNFVRAGERRVAMLGVEDLVVVDTDHTLLIAHRSRSQEVKLLAQQMPEFPPAVKAGQTETVHRPWGCYKSVDAQERFQVKRISVDPGAKLSLQLHHHRAEHWVVVRGTARVTIDDRVVMLKENESTYIPIGSMHRLENPGRIRLEVIEVQTGSYLGEDDIVRFDDDYGRETARQVAEPQAIRA